MKRLILVALFVITIAPFTFAQDTPRVEVFGGYSFRTERRETNQDFGNINGLTPAQIKAALGVDISGNTGSAQSKIEALSAAGAAIAETIEDVVRLTAEKLGTPVLG